jgi:hypothetical protein
MTWAGFAAAIALANRPDKIHAGQTAAGHSHVIFSLSFSPAPAAAAAGE